MLLSLCDARIAHLVGIANVPVNESWRVCTLSPLIDVRGSFELGSSRFIVRTGVEYKTQCPVPAQTVRSNRRHVFRRRFAVRSPAPIPSLFPRLWW